MYTLLYYLSFKRPGDTLTSEIETQSHHTIYDALAEATYEDNLRMSVC